MRRCGYCGAFSPERAVHCTECGRAMEGRLVMALEYPIPGDEESLQLRVIKSNLPKFPEPLGMEIDEAKGPMFGLPPEVPREETLKDKAADLLLALLNRGPKPATEVYEEAEQAGLGKETPRRAKKSLGVVAVRRTDRWVWSLPQRGGTTLLIQV